MVSDIPRDRLRLTHGGNNWLSANHDLLPRDPRRTAVRRRRLADAGHPLLPPGAE